MTFDDTNDEYLESSDIDQPQFVAPTCSTEGCTNTSAFKRGMHMCKVKSVDHYQEHCRVCINRLRVQAFMATPEGKAYAKEYERRPERIARARERGKIYYANSSPEKIARRVAYRQRPDVKAKQAEYRNTPEAKAKARAYAKSPEVRAKRREAYKNMTQEARDKRNAWRRGYRQRDDVKAKEKEYANRPEVRAHRKQWCKNHQEKPEVKEYRNAGNRMRRKTPEFRAKRQIMRQQPEYRKRELAQRKAARSTPEFREHRKEYRQRPHVKAKERDYRDARMKKGKHYPTGLGGKRHQWNKVQNRRGMILPHPEIDGFEYSKIKHLLHTDHLVPRSLLESIGITDRKATCVPENLHEMHISHNTSKSGRILNKWLESMYASPETIEAGWALYQRAVAAIVKAQQEIDPSYVLTDERRAILGLDA